MAAMSDRPLRVFICAGEHSGDSHGAALAKRLRQRDPTIELHGLGGPAQHGIGVDRQFELHFGRHNQGAERVRTVAPPPCQASTGPPQEPAPGPDHLR